MAAWPSKGRRRSWSFDSFPRYHASISYWKQTQFSRRLWRSALAFLRFPGVIQLAAFTILYKLAAHYWCKHYCGILWAPGWPDRFRVFVILLAVTPVYALLHCLWILTSDIFYPAFVKRHDLPAIQLDAQYMLLEEAPTSPRSPTSAFFPRTAETMQYRSFWSWLRLSVCALVAVSGIHSAYTYQHPGDIRYRSALSHALAHPKGSGYHSGDKVFIAAAFYNNEEVLSYWSDTLIKVIRYLGTENVFVSVVENYSSDRTPQLLRGLDKKLEKMNVSRRILIDDRTIKRPPEMSWNPRIEFLSAIRNQALEPLVQKGGYDKVVFSNDIYIEPESWIELLETAGGDYDMACGMDFGHWGAYDAWVLRDRLGKLTSAIWPYFFDAADYEAIKFEAPIPVFTCWNGIVAFKPDPLLPVSLRRNTTLSASPLTTPFPSTNPNVRGSSPALTPPIQFRASVPGECFSSECFLFPYDMRRVFGMEKIYMNPRVVVAYQWKFYVWFKWVMRHWIVKWWVEKVWDGAWMQNSMMVVGDPKRIWTWDGGECHPW